MITVIHARKNIMKILRKSLNLLDSDKKLDMGFRSAHRNKYSCSCTCS